MAIQLTEKNGGKVLEVQVSDKLAHEDYLHFVPEFERLVKRNGKIRVPRLRDVSTGGAETLAGRGPSTIVRTSHHNRL